MFKLNLFVDVVYAPCDGAKDVCARAVDAVQSVVCPVVGGECGVNVRLSDDEEVRELNKQYRGKDKPTNVLSFEDGDVVDGVCCLGDIIIAKETCIKEAAEEGITVENHLAHLVVHGVLHVYGFDHIEEVEAEEMEALEVEILAKMGISSPY